MRNLITTTTIPIHRIVSTTTVDNDTDCCPITAPCLPDGVILPRTLYLECRDSAGRYARSIEACMDLGGTREYCSSSATITGVCHTFYERAFVMNWQANPDYPLTSPYMGRWVADYPQVPGATPGTVGYCFLGVYLWLAGSGTGTHGGLGCLSRLLGSLGDGITGGEGINSGPTDGAELQIVGASLDPVYLYFIATGDGYAGHYYVTE